MILFSWILLIAVLTQIESFLWSRSHLFEGHRLPAVAALFLFENEEQEHVLLLKSV